MTNRPSKVRIVVDANVIVSSPRLNSGPWRALLRASDRGLVDLLIPEVCLLEADSWFRREMPGRIADYKKALARLEHMGLRLERDYISYARPHDILSIGDEHTAAYSAYLRERICNHATVIPIPDVAHAVLVERATSRRRPFTEKGTGYRDALIWFSVLALAEEGPLVFLTSNTKDFADGTNLHPDLVDDLVAAGLRGSHVVLEVSLSQLVQSTIPEEELDVRSDLEQSFRSNEAIAALASALDREFAASGYEYLYPASEDDGLPAPFVNPSFEWLWDIHDVTIEGAKPIGDDSHAVVGRCRGTTRVYEIIAESWADKLRVGSDGVVRMSLGTEGGLAVAADRPVEFAFSAVFTPPAEVDEAEVLEVTPLGSGGGTPAAPMRRDRRRWDPFAAR
jgi:hypothetical protein